MWAQILLGLFVILAPADNHSSSSTAVGDEESSSNTHSSASDCISSSSSSHSSSGHKWYSEDHDHDLVETVVLSVMVVCALGFEVVWHHLTHNNDNSYRYGDLYDKIFFENEQNEDGNTPHEHHAHHHNHFVRIDFHGNLMHSRLQKELTHRLGAEFMTLGFLAFIIFTVNQSGGFEYWSDRVLDYGWKEVPQSESDWLHLCEEVHMELFIGMILYFILVARIVHHSIRKLKSWEQVHLRNVWAPTGDTRRVESTDKRLSQYRLWREYFFTEVSRWYITDTPRFEGLAARLDVRLDVDNPVEPMRNALERHLSMAGYLAVSVERGVEDSISIHPFTWLGLIVLLAIFALVHRFAELSLSTLYPIFASIAFMLLFFCYLVDRWMVHRIKNVHEAHASKAPVVQKRKSRIPEINPVAAIRDLQTRAHWAGPGNHVDSHVYRALQAFLFLNSYMLSRSLMNKLKWEEDTQSHLLFVLIGLFLYCCLLAAVPRLVPRFLAMRSLPPYMANDEIFTLLLQLIDDRVEANGVDETPRSQYSLFNRTPYSAATHAQKPARVRKRFLNLTKNHGEHLGRSLPRDIVTSLTRASLDDVGKQTSSLSNGSDIDVPLTVRDVGYVFEKLEGMDAKLNTIQEHVCSAASI